MMISDLLISFILISQSISSAKVDCEPSAKTEANDILKKAEVSEISWLSSFEAARADAIKNKRDIFLLFTSSGGWCHGCVHLDKYAFSNKKFVDATSSKFTFIKYVFPPTYLDETKKKAANAELQEALRYQGKFDQSNFPKIILFTADGKAYSRPTFGNTETPEDFTNEILKAEKSKSDFFEKLAKIKSNPNITQRQKDLDEFISKLEDEAIGFSYQDEMRELAENSPYASKYKYYLALYAAKESFGALDSQKALDQINSIFDIPNLPLDYQSNALTLKQYALQNLQRNAEAGQVQAIAKALNEKISKLRLEGKLGEQK